MNVHIPQTHKMLKYEGKEPYSFTAYTVRPYPTLTSGDVVVVEQKTAKWLVARNLPFSIISPDDLVLALTPYAKTEEGFFDKAKKIVQGAKS